MITRTIKTIVCLLVLAGLANQSVSAAAYPNATVSRLRSFTLTAAEHAYNSLGGADDSIDRPLDIVMNFKANETRDEANAGPFGKWTCDFYLTFSNLTGETISAEGSYLAGHYGSFGWWVIPTDEFETLEGDLSYPVMAAKNITLEYAADICGSVKDFTAAIFINRQVLAKNPGMKVTLELRMTNPDNTDEQITVGSYTYTAAMLGDPVAPDVTVGADVAVDDAFKAAVGEALADANRQTAGGVKVEIAAKTDTAVTYEITGAKNAIPDNGLKMTFPVAGLANGETAYVVHTHEAKKYVYAEPVVDGCVTINNMLGFSTFTVSGTGLADALAAGGDIVLESDLALNATVTVPADVSAALDLNGRTLSGAPGVRLVNLGDLTVSDSSAEMTGMLTFAFENAGTANLTGGLFMGGVSNTGNIHVTGGGYATPVATDWMPAGYACGKVTRGALTGYLVAKLPTATVTAIPAAELNGAPDLTFSLKFKADAVSAAQMLCFTNWYADFELTLDETVQFNESDPNSDGFLSGSYDNWLNGSWVSVPTSNVTIQANTPLRIMAFGADLLGQKGLKMTYGEIATTVKVFRCGIVLREAFRAAHPGFKASLALKMYNPENENECFTIGSLYDFTLPTEDDSLTVKDNTGKIVHCETLADAIAEVAAAGQAANGSEIILLKNTAITNDLTLTGTRNLFVDLENGASLTLGAGRTFALTGINVAFVGNGTLNGFSAENVVLDDQSILTLPKQAEGLAEALEDKGLYVAQNADGTWSVATAFRLQINMADGNVPQIGLLEDTRRVYTIETSSNLTDWTAVEVANAPDGGTADSLAAPLTWKVPPQSGRFFRAQTNW